MLNTAVVTKRAREGPDEEISKKRIKNEAFASMSVEDITVRQSCCENRQIAAVIPIKYMGGTPEVLSECDEESEIEVLAPDWEYLVEDILRDDRCANEYEPLSILTEIRWSADELGFFSASILDSTISAEHSRRQCCFDQGSEINESSVHFDGSRPQAFSEGFEDGQELELDAFTWQQYVQWLCDDFACCTHASLPKGE